MKYLKDLEEFGKDKNIIYDIEDMLKEIEDIGFETYLNKSYSTDIYKLTIRKNDKVFNIVEELKELIIRLYNFLSSEKFFTNMEYFNGERNKFYVRGDKLRNSDIIFMNSKWPTIYDIEINFFK